MLHSLDVGTWQRPLALLSFVPVYCNLMHQVRVLGDESYIGLIPLRFDSQWRKNEQTEWYQCEHMDVWYVVSLLSLPNFDSSLF